MDDDLTRARACLRAAGFDPPEDELAELAQGYAQMRAMVAMLATVEEARDEPPATGFRARLT